MIDLGVGHGKTGVLMREYLDIMQERYRPEDWKTEIYGIEGFAGYANPLWTYAYDRVLVRDALEGLREMPDVDLIVALDIWEHFNSDYAEILLETCLTKGKYLLLSTPMYPLPQGSVFGNSYERHLTRWSPNDFIRVPHRLHLCTSDDWIILLSSTREIPSKIRSLSNPLRTLTRGFRMALSQWAQTPIRNPP